MVTDNGSFEWPPAGSGGGGGSGTVTSVAVVSDTLQVSGSPITSSGTIHVDAVGNPHSFAWYNADGDLSNAPGWTADDGGQVLGFLVSNDDNHATSLQLGAVITTPLSGGYEGIIVGGDFSSTMAFQSSFNAENTYEATFVLNGGVEQYQEQSTVLAGAVIASYTVFNAGPTIAGTINAGGIRGFALDVTSSGATDGFTAFADFSSFTTGGSNSGDYHGINLTPAFNTGYTIRSFTGVEVNPNLVANVTDDAYGMRISMQNFTAGTQIVGLNINMNGAVDNDPQGVRAISAVGRVDTNHVNNLVSGQTFQIGNRIESLLRVAPGSPVTGTDSLGNNLAGDLEAEDDLANGLIGIGWNSVGFIASVAVAAGKTVDKATVFLPASSLPDPGFTTGGTFTDFGVIRIYSPLAQGGTAVFGDVYGLQINPQFGNLPGTTGNWGVWVGDTGADNWFAKSVTIGGTTGKSPSGVGLQVFGHLRSSQSTGPTEVPTANAGTGASAVVTGTDSAGSLGLVTGTTAFGAGAQVVITFNVPYVNAPRISLTPTNTNAALAAVNVFVTKTANDFTINFINPDIISTSYTWDYVCVEAS